MIALPRLFKNDGFFHFKGKIHEQPQWKDSPNGIFNLNSLFKHYGYDHADKGLMELKFQRSRRLLEEELTKNPDNIYYRYQLSNTYGMYGQTDKALEEIRKTYHLMAKQKRHRRLLITVYERYTSYAIDQNHLEEAEKICLEGIDLEPEYVDLHFILARLYASQGRDSAAIKSYQDYLELIGRYDRLKIVNDPSIPIYYSNKSDEAMLDLSKLYCRTEDYNSSMQITEQLIGAGSDLPTPVLEQGLAVYVEAALKSKKFSKLKELYLSLAKLEGKKYFLEKLEVSRIALPENEQTGIIDLFAQSEGIYADLNKIRVAFREKRLPESKEKIQRLAADLDFNSESDFYADLFFFQISLKQSLPDVFNRLTKEKADSLFKYLLQTRKSVSGLVRDYILDLADSQGFAELRLSRSLLKHTLLYGELSDNDYSELLKMLMQIGVKYSKALYNRSVMETQQWQFLDREDGFLLQLTQAKEEKDRGNFSQALKLLKNSLKTYPELNRGVEILTKELQNSTDALREYAEYARQIKKNIEDLINKDELDSAVSLLTEVERIVGRDSELVSMRAVINLKQGQLEENKQLLQQALNRDPRNFELLYNLGNTHELDQNFPEALDYYQKAKEFCPDQAMSEAIEEYITIFKDKTV